MTIYDRPDEKVMAESALAGEVQDFPDILRGWGVAFDQTGGIPPMEWFNALAKRTDQAIRYFMQRGLPEWSASEDYPLGSYVQYAGSTYLSKRANTNKQPNANVNDWGRWSVTRDEFDTATHASRQQSFTTNGSFTVPSGVTTVYVSATAGGGGGAGAGGTGASPGTGGGGAGGGAGQYVYRMPIAVTPGQVIPVTIGAGGTHSNGAPANTSATAAGNGGATSFGALLTLTGGGGGGPGSSGPIGSSSGGIGGTGFPNGGWGVDGSNTGGAGSGGQGASTPFGSAPGAVRSALSSGLTAPAGAGFGCGGGGGSAAWNGANIAGGAGADGRPGFLGVEW